MARRSRVYKPDSEPDGVRWHTDLFLAGSIEQGKAIDWQAQVEKDFEDYPLNIYNPRRSVWNSELDQTFTNEQFREQVTWEQKHLLSSNYVLVNFTEGTLAPISLLELGQLSQTKQTTVVACPKSYWRRGNIEIVCIRFGIPLYETLDEAVSHLKTIIPKS